MAPVLGAEPKLLILGSMPGVASLEAQRYYAHPRNLFWPLLADILQFALCDDFAQRYQQLTSRGIALWDVLAHCERQGSLDSAIRKQSVLCNPIIELVQQHPSIQRICVNGSTAWTLLNKHQPRLSDLVELVKLPSTSPAHASVSRAEKRAAWQQGLGISPV
ncbi:DNA-deoxyinosine glycosylase [Rheinheimera sp.]|uniref:DNA-deoxyinosine glycosylase n=1 Tax=Rheinheimera sp. TaxID=1869214 RepID=UPI00307E7A39